MLFRSHAGRRLRAGAAQDQINRAIILLASLSGMATENMTRGDGWRFLDIGKRLERALQMTELLRYALAGEAREDVGVLEAVLEMADSSITYRSRYLTSLHASLVLDLLLVDEANPRSVAYQLMQLRDRIDQLPHAHTAIRRPQESREAMALLTTVQLADVRELANSGGSTDALATLLEGLSASLTQLSETLSTAYFSHVVPPRLLAVP
mgnify:FL=1